MSDETCVSSDIVDRYHDKVDNVEEVDEQICWIACKVMWNCEYRNCINIAEIGGLLHEIEINENV